MNELTLSNNLAEIELEINHHKQIAGRSIWEIGRRLNHVKENDLVHGQFIEWLKNIELSQREAYRMMKVAKEVPNLPTLANLGSTALYLIATLPDDEKQAQISKIEQGDTPTVRELQEVKRKLNAAQAENQRLAEKNEELAEQVLTQAQPEPQIVEKIKEVEPQDYQATKDLNKTLLEKNKQLTNDLMSAELDLRLSKQELSQIEEDAAESIALRDAIETLRADKKKLESSMDNLMELTSLSVEIEDFFDNKMAPLRFKTLIQGLGKEVQIDRIRELLTVIDNWLMEMYQIVPLEGRKIVEGEIINE